MTIKDDIRRVRRRCVEGLNFCLANGIKPTPGTWLSGTQACAIGAVFAKKGYRYDRETASLLDKQNDPVWDEHVRGATLLNLKDEMEVTALTKGFDLITNEFKPHTRHDAFYKLGASLREKYVL